MFGLQQLVDRATCRNAILDLAITEYSGTVTYHPHLESSDHISLFLNLKVSLQVLSPLTPRRIYHWNSAPWNHIRGPFRHVQWDVLRSGTISDAAEAFANNHKGS